LGNGGHLDGLSQMAQAFEFVKDFLG